MTDEELERTLAAAFDAQARAAVGDSARPPEPRFARMPARRARRAGRVLAPLLAAAAVVAVVVGLANFDPTTNGHDAAARPTSPGPHSTPSSATGRAVAPGKAVRIKLLNPDGAEYGVGMPVIAYFSRKITSGRELQRATTATVNGKPIPGAWYFEYSSYFKGYPIEGHWRPQTYWPAHASVQVDISAAGLSAGRGLAFADSVTSDFTTGPRNISMVDDMKHRMTVTTDGHIYGTFPVSLGGKATPTMRGIKVIMEKGQSICMSGPGYDECGVRYTQRLTYAGEYLHSAPWNVSNIVHGVDSSNGCTNLLPADARRLYRLLRVGDVVEYPNTSGPAMQAGAGYGDWDVPWSTWRAGGLVPTR
ncbi:MAG TPA: L,D-transpeptidase [Jatrophihabitans sp.]|nr:L,D-transpeptidase [Jatrophihabitans sp.]